MNDLPLAVALIVTVIGTGVFLFFAADRIERWTEVRRRAESQREAQRQRDTIEIIREVGRQTLGTLRPGEVPPDVYEEEPQSPVSGSTEWWTEPGDETDPTDAELPDPTDLTDPGVTDPGVQNLG